MANFNVNLKDKDGNLLFPQTNQDVVLTPEGTLTVTIGDLSSLLTTVKTSLVAAINELKNGEDDIKDDVSDLETALGDLEDSLTALTGQVTTAEGDISTNANNLTNHAANMTADVLHLTQELYDKLLNMDDKFLGIYSDLTALQAVTPPNADIDGWYALVVGVGYHSWNVTGQNWVFSDTPIIDLNDFYTKTECDARFATLSALETLSGIVTEVQVTIVEIQTDITNLKEGLGDLGDDVEVLENRIADLEGGDVIGFDVLGNSSY